MIRETLFLFAPTGQSGGASMFVFLFQMLAIIAIFAGSAITSIWSMRAAPVTT